VQGRKKLRRCVAARLKAAGCKAAGRKAARQKCRTWLLLPKSKIALLARLPLRRGENVVLLKFGTPKSLHIPHANVDNKQNLEYFRKTRGQKETKLCTLHTDCLSGGVIPPGEEEEEGGWFSPDPPNPQLKVEGSTPRVGGFFIRGPFSMDVFLCVFGVHCQVVACLRQRLRLPAVLEELLGGAHVQ
jgi:hypothetical protein